MTKKVLYSALAGIIMGPVSVLLDYGVPFFHNYFGAATFYLIIPLFTCFLAVIILFLYVKNSKITDFFMFMIIYYIFHILSGFILVMSLYPGTI